ncbi:unnamed protein product [Rotaria sordida]|uniref:Uncharacterized protein n=1 Tax=Rotaria sordida TaxID=392033 RepID=A0A819KNX0_9BILA|nr:unnamed protein product [Rotaria sordida]CAF3973672.1 unnamed protein product [Rotaria sordida]
MEFMNALTLGIILFEIQSIVIGPLIDRFECRFVKLIAIIFHIIGWLTLALVAPAYTSSDYFSKSRAFVAALFAGACTSATMWYSIFQILIDAGKITLQQLSYIWMSFDALMLISSFLFLDLKFPILNLPYKFDTKLEKKQDSCINTTNENSSSNNNEIDKMKWYTRILKQKGVWHHLTSPLYILVVLFLTNKYTFAFNLSTVSAILIYPINGFLLGFKADKGKKQKLFNLSLMQTVSWLINIVACIVCMFAQTNMIISALVINYFARATIVDGSQAVVVTFFQSEYIGTLTDVMWTLVGAIATVQYALVKLTDTISRLRGAWSII